MKNFTLLAVAVLMATSVFAAPQRSKQLTLQGQNVRPRTEMAKPIKGRQQAKSAAVKSQAPRRALGIVDQPEGTLYENMIVSYEGYAPSFFGVSYTSAESGYINLVEAADGTLYIQNLFPYLADEEVYWIKAEKVDDQGNYVIHKQPAGYYASYDIVDYVTRMEYFEDEESATYNEAEETDIPLTWKDGVLSTTEAFADGQTVLGVAWEDEDGFTWEGDAVYNLSAQAMTDTYSVPDSEAEVLDYVMQFTVNGEKSVQPVQVVFQDKQVFLKLFADAQGWIVGTIDGNQVTVKSGQYLGVAPSYGSHEWMHVAKTQLAYYEDEEYPDYSYYYDELVEMFDEDVLTFDPTTRTFVSQNSISIDNQKDGVNSAEIYVTPTIKVFFEVPARPADPAVSYFANYDEDYGYGLVDFHIPTMDINGEYITPEKLSYVVYVDDEVFVFEADEYKIEEDMEEVPFNLNNDADIYEYYGDKEIVFYFSIADNIGVQTIYRGGDEEHKSNIVMYDINKNEPYVIEVEDTPVAVNSPLARTQAFTSYFDLSGRRANAAAKGLVIRSTTAADGTRRVVKLVRK